MAYMSKTRSSGLQRVVWSLVSLVMLWILFFVFEETIDVVDNNVTNTGKFGNSIDLLNALPEIIGLIGSLFLIINIFKGFKQLSL